MDVDVPSKFDVPSSTSKQDDNDNENSRTTKITPAQRIAELNAIDHSVSTLLKSASTATAVLSNQSPPSSSSTSLSAAQSTFQSAANVYFSTLSSIEVRLRRQVYALEEAGLVPAGDERDARRGRAFNTDDSAGGLTRRGMGGPLDPSWLNARVSDGVEIGMKKEVLEQAKKVIEKARAVEPMDSDEVHGDADADADMDVDEVSENS